MTGHYMYGCDYDHFRRLLAEHQADLDPAQRGRIEECLRYSRFLTRFAKIERFFWDKRIRAVEVWNDMVRQCCALRPKLVELGAVPDYCSAIFEPANLFGL